MNKKELEKEIRNAIEKIIPIVQKDITVCWLEMLEDREISENVEMNCEGCEYEPICQMIQKYISEK